MDIKYEDALKELEAILSRMEDAQRDFSESIKDVKRAQELIKHCKSILKENEVELDKILNNEELQ